MVSDLFESMSSWAKDWAKSGGSAILLKRDDFLTSLSKSGAGKCQKRNLFMRVWG